MGSVDRVSTLERGDVTVRPERPEDEDAVRRLVGDAFGGERVPDLLDALRSGDGWVGLSFVAEQESGAGPRVVGHVAYTRSLLDAPDRLRDVLVLSPLAVAPDRQRRGIGRRLVHASLDALDDRPEPLVVLEGSPAYYSALGFVPAETLGLRRPSLRIPPAAFQAWPLPAYDAAGGPDVVRGTVVYHRTFWDHDCVGLRDR